MLTSFITPGLVFLISVVFLKFPPKKINSIYGYRTTRSSESIEAWNEANKYSAKLMIKTSLLAMVVNAILLIVFGTDDKGIGIATFTSSMITVVLLFVVIAITEKHLKDMFEN